MKDSVGEQGQFELIVLRQFSGEVKYTAESEPDLRSRYRNAQQRGVVYGNVESLVATASFDAAQMSRYMIEMKERRMKERRKERMNAEERRGEERGRACQGRL